MIKVRFLLKESTQNSNDIAEHNINFLSDLPRSVLQLKKETSHGVIYHHDISKHIREVVESFSQLSKFRIKGFLGMGAYGIVFLLDNDHAIKIFASGSGENTARDIQWYHYCKERLHGGFGKIVTLPVYHIANRTINGEKVYYVEMARFTPLVQFIKSTGRDRDSASWDLNLLKSDVQQFYKYGGNFSGDKNLYKQLNDFLEKEKTIKSNSREEQTFTQAELESLTLMLKELYNDTRFKNTDLHIGNIGFLQQSRPDKPIFIVFDI